MKGVHLHVRDSPTGNCAIRGGARYVPRPRARGQYARRGRRDFVDGSCAHQRTAADAALGSEVDEPVGAADEVEVVLDGDDGVAGLEQLAERGEQHLDVAAVQPRGRLVEQEQRRAGAARGADARRA